ncbi:Na(+)/H(+) antiporter subunit B [Psychromonas sp.]|uniref:Na(+)/H(+) antiporter subunit B n=1 Tax=Psychromonas sp. TaxID=1884585 RepID=UPI003566D3F8
MDKNRCLLLPLLLVLAMGIGYAVLSLPDHADGLQKVVAVKMEVSGVSNPVTAVLLNFRGYDTLLEMAVLLLALLGCWSLAGSSLQVGPASGPVLDTFARLLSPLLILMAAYLLWSGSHAPGGAFQAGAVLGAAGVLQLLAGWRLRPCLTQILLRLALIAGLAAFITIALLMLFLEGRVLQYPPDQAGILILILETVATLSIGVTLAALFLGGQQEQKDKQ